MLANSSWLRQTWVWLLAAVVLAACGSDAVPRETPGSVKEPSTAALNKSNATSMPGGLRAAHVASVQGEAGEKYRVSMQRGLPTAVNPSHRFTTRFVPAGPTITASGWNASLTLTGYGCVQQRRAAPRATVSSRDNRVQYARDGLVEWYLNGPLGLEQGFTLASDPGCAGEIALDVELDGVAPRAGSDGRSAQLRDKSGKLVAGYEELWARDARGQELAARLVVEGQRIGIRVDARGAEFPVTVDPLVAVHEAELLALDGAADDQFGYSVSISGDTALVGADNKTVGVKARQGVAYVYVRSAGIWTQQTKLMAGDGAANDHFGYSVSLSGDTAVIGAYQKAVGANIRQGAAYVFHRSAGNWTEQDKLIASDGAATAEFGASVSISGDTVVVGAHFAAVSGHATQGAAYVYLRSGVTWAQQAKLIAADGAAEDEFGYSVSISGDTALVGADYKTVGVNAGQGAAYVYDRSGGTWAQQAKLTASDGGAGDSLGFSVSISGDTALVGAPFKPIAGNTYRGATYMFLRSGVNWTQQARVVALDGAAGDYFGFAVSISGDRAIIGAPLKTVSGYTQLGLAYVWVRDNGNWTQIAPLYASDSSNDQFFGYSVALDGNTALVGAVIKTINGQSAQGAASVFNLYLSIGDACTGDADCLSGYCVDQVCCNTVCTAPCVACKASLKQSQADDGTCDAAQAGLDPHDSCAVDPPASCGNTGVCDGTGACSLYDPTTECAPRSCATGTSENLPDTCSGSGQCVDQGAAGCQTGYGCVAGSCKTSCASVTDCAQGYYCNGSNQCVVVIDDGSPCQTDSSCAHNHCVDGVCCNSVCGGGSQTDCQACSVANNGLVDGTCGVSTGNSCSVDGGTGTCQSGICVVTEADSGVDGAAGQAGAAGEGGAAGEAGAAGEGGGAGQAGASGLGGAAGQAGASGQGGAAGQAGASGQGGASGQAGASGHAGTTSSGGNAGSGGSAHAGASGNPAAGAAGTAPAESPPADDTGGCGCSTPGSGAKTSTAALGAMLLLIVSRRRRCSRRLLGAGLLFVSHSTKRSTNRPGSSSCLPKYNANAREKADAAACLSVNPERLSSTSH